MHYEWSAAEHYRSHTVEEWLSSRRKEATLAAIQSSLVSLSWSRWLQGRWNAEFVSAGTIEVPRGNED